MDFNWDYLTFTSFPLEKLRAEMGESQDNLNPFTPVRPLRSVKYDVIFHMPVFCIHMTFRLPQYM